MPHDLPSWLILLLLPLLGSVLLLAWILTRGRSSSLTIRGLGVSVELKENTTDHHVQKELT